MLILIFYFDINILKFQYVSMLSIFFYLYHFVFDTIILIYWIWYLNFKSFQYFLIFIIQFPFDINISKFWCDSIFSDFCVLISLLWFGFLYFNFEILIFQYVLILFNLWCAQTNHTLSQGNSSTTALCQLRHKNSNKAII